MTPLLVLDSNIYISAVLFGGKPRLILEASLAGHVRLAISSLILEEIQGVLRGKKFRFPPAAAREIIAEISGLAKTVEPTESVTLITDDPDDDRILECALASSADAIVTGDSHLLGLASFRGIPILDVSSCLEKYRLMSRV